MANLCYVFFTQGYVTLYFILYYCAYYKGGRELPPRLGILCRSYYKVPFLINLFNY